MSVQTEIISTHAPAGGATRLVVGIRRRLTISTHAPAGGATEDYRVFSRGEFDFYSRPCGRGDLLLFLMLLSALLFLLTPLREGRLRR